MQPSYQQSPYSGADSPRPPISKFYQSTSPGWASAGVQQIPQGFVVPGANAESSPSLPPRPSHNPSALTAPLRTNQPSSPGDGGLTWHLPVPPPSAPLASQLGSSTYNPQTYGLMPSAQQSPGASSWNQDGHPRIEPDPSKWGVNYNHSHAQSMDQMIKPPLPPRPSSATESRQSQSQSQSRVSSTQNSYSHNDHYRLQPVAYNPNASLLVQDEIRNSWQEGDDLELSQPPRRPPKVPRRPSGLQQILQAVPQDPVYSPGTPTHRYSPSYHQQETNVPHTIPHPQHANHYSAQLSRPPPDTPGHDEGPSSLYTLPHAPPLPPQRSTESRQRLGERLHKASISPLSAEDGAQWSSLPGQPPVKAPYVSPPKPASAVLAQDFAYQSQSNPQFNPGDTSWHQLPRGQTPVLHESLLKNEIRTVSLPEAQSPSTEEVNNRAKDTNDTFYWHSPQSSTDASAKKEATMVDNELQQGLATEVGAPTLGPAVDATKVNTPSNSVLYNASALGFGGPSDWEYFGDYNTEVIDDTELYTSSKSKAKIGAFPDTAELPANTSPMEATKAVLEMGQADTDGRLQSTPPVSATVTQAQSDSSQQGRTYSITAAPDSTQREGVSPTTQERITLSSDMPAPLQRSSESEQTLSPLPVKVPNDAQTKESPSSTQNQALASSSSQDPELVSRQGDFPKKPQGVAGVEENPLATHEDSERTESLEDARDPLEQGRLSEHVTLLEPPTQPSQIVGEEVLGITQATTNAQEEPGPEHQTHVITGRSNDHSASSDLAPAVHNTQSNERLVHPSSELNNSEDKQHHDDQARTGQDGTNNDVSTRGETSGDESGEDIIISLQHQESISHSQTPPPNSSQSTSTDHSGHVRPEKARRSVFPKSIELNDPYANLDPWAKASLNRYVKMLREEAQAEMDEEKYLIFMTFTRRESRLRAVLYDVEDEPEFPEQTTHRPPLGKYKSTMSFHPSISKALPALPAEAEQETPLTHRHSINKSSALSHIAEAAQAFQEQDFNKRTSSDESYVMIDSPVERPYSPGGRPIVTRPLREKNEVSSRPTIPAASSSAGFNFGQVQRTGGSGAEPPSPGANAPIVLRSDAEIEEKGSERPRSVSVPLATPQHFGSETVRVIGNPDRAVYTPFRYNEGRPHGDVGTVNRQSTYRPFSMLRQGSLRHGSLDSGTGHQKHPMAQRRDTFDTPPTTRKEYAETFFHPKNGNSIPGVLEAGIRKMPSLESALQERGTTSNSHDLILGPLLTVLPQSSLIRPESRHMVNLRQAIDAVVDEYSFIHKAVLTWDVDAKKTREQHEKERHLRQGESEQKFDALFNDNEIGYGDISDLEAEFKRSEAARKADEDRAEYQSFVCEVFDTVWARLHYEMDQLNPLYEQCTQMVTDAPAGKDMFEDTQGRVAIAPAMDNLLNLYQKLGIRHQKAFEAVLERDRRLKKTEVAPWYALGDIKKVKQLKKRFEEAEKNAILQFCRQRDERANELMDILGPNTRRGVGANQDYMESIMQAVRNIAMEAALGAVPEDVVISTDQILKAKTITTALARSSEQIVQTFHVADMLLNAAGYEVSVANARLMNADAATFKRLSEEKRNEDQKLMEDLEHRLSLIRGGSNRTHDEITKLLSLLVNNAGNATPPGRPTSAPADPDHEARLQKALEEAKRRNALKDAGADEFS